MADSVGQGGRIENTVRVTLTGTVARGSFVTLAGANSADGAFGFVSLEDGVSGQKIAAQHSGVAVVLVGDTIAAGDPITADAAGAGEPATGTDIINGRALQAGAIGDYVQVVLGAN